MQVRALHMRDVEFGPSWRALLKDFDERLLSFSLVYGSVASCGYHSLIRLSNSYREFTVITDFGKFSSKRNHLNQQIWGSPRGPRPKFLCQSPNRSLRVVACNNSFGMVSQQRSHHCSRHIKLKPKSQEDWRAQRFMSWMWKTEYQTNRRTSWKTRHSNSFWCLDQIVHWWFKFNQTKVNTMSQCGSWYLSILNFLLSSFATFRQPTWTLSCRRINFLLAMEPPDSRQLTRWLTSSGRNN